jgi:hypothetical protein
MICSIGDSFKVVILTCMVFSLLSPIVYLHIKRHRDS